MRISTRLATLGGALACLLLLVGGLGLYGISASNDALRAVYEERTVPASQIGSLSALVVENQLALSTALITPTPELIERSTRTVQANLQRMDELWRAYRAQPLAGEEAQLAERVGADRQRFEAALQPALAALRANDIIEGQNILTTQLAQLYPPLKQGLDALSQAQVHGAQQAYGTARSRYSTIRALSITATVLGLLALALVGGTMVRTLVRQLGAEPSDAAAVAHDVGAGDLSQTITTHGADHSSLMAQMHAMQQRLIGVVGHVRQGADGVATASAEIAQGNQDLSARTEAQASALQQTSASMRTLGQTVNDNADHARQASTLAQEAAQVAQQGGAVVNQVVQTMRGIHGSSRRIADIIGVIDGIAFQTNILALNAAVEAARAGEQGRGFAVVASEVRSLAQRSAEAAREIKSLITASVEQVEHGSTLVDQAGNTMQTVVQSIERVSTLVRDISGASSAQAQGIAQVSEAMAHMDHGTQQNAALVEEMAAAATSLQTQAQELVQTVAVFKLPGAAHGHSTAVQRPWLALEQGPQA